MTSVDPVDQLRQLMKQPGNRHCADCGNPGPTYVNVTIGTFVCTACSGRLRGLATAHRVKSVSVATFTQSEIDFVRKRGNEWSRNVWLATYDENFYSDVDPKNNRKMDRLISDKYEKKLYYREPVEQSSSAASVAGSSTGPLLLPDAPNSSLTPTPNPAGKPRLCGAVSLPGLAGNKEFTLPVAFPRIVAPPAPAGRAKLRAVSGVSFDAAENPVDPHSAANGDSFADFSSAFSGEPTPLSNSHQHQLSIISQPCDVRSSLLIPMTNAGGDYGNDSTSAGSPEVKSSDKYGALKELDDTFRVQSAGPAKTASSPGPVFGFSRGGSSVQAEWSLLSSAGSSSPASTYSALNAVNGASVLQQSDLPTQQPWSSPQSQPPQPWPSQQPQQNPWPSQQPQQNPWPSQQPQQNPWPSQQPQQNPWPSQQPQQNPWPSQQPSQNSWASNIQPQQPQKNSWASNSLPQQPLQNSWASNSQPQQLQQSSWATQIQQQNPQQNPWSPPQNQPWPSQSQTQPAQNKPWSSPQTQPQQPQNQPQSAQGQSWPSHGQPQQPQQNTWSLSQNQPQNPWPSQNQPQNPWSSQNQSQLQDPWPSSQNQDGSWPVNQQQWPSQPSLLDPWSSGKQEAVRTSPDPVQHPPRPLPRTLSSKGAALNPFL